MLLTGVLTFVMTLLQTAPYGRYASPIWGPSIPARIAWTVFESPNLIVPALFLFFSDTPKRSANPNRLLLLFFIAHYVHRAIIYPWLRMPRTTAPMPISIVCVAFMYCTWNATQQCVALLFVNSYPRNWTTDIRFISGLGIGITGMIINIRSDSILLQLRARGGYHIPRGELFEYVSGANFFGEIMEWTGWAIAVWRLHAFAFAYYVFCNTSTRAWGHHQYYLKKFREEYPAKRRAVIPFIW